MDKTSRTFLVPIKAFDQRHLSLVSCNRLSSESAAANFLDFLAVAAGK